MKKLGENGGTHYWLIGKDVWCTVYGDLDGNEKPMGLRWECTKEHFDHYRTNVYQFVN